MDLQFLNSLISVFSCLLLPYIVEHPFKILRLLLSLLHLGMIMYFGLFIGYVRYIIVALKFWKMIADLSNASTLLMKSCIFKLNANGIPFFRLQVMFHKNTYAV